MYEGLLGDLWELSTGTIVEEQMRKCAKANKFEQGAHSMIMDPLDPVWINWFTKDELEEISSHRSPSICPLPDDMETYLRSFEKKSKLDDLWDRVREDNFHPKKQAGLYWLQQSNTNALELYYCDFHTTGAKSESDLLHRIWRPVYLCFDHSTVSVVSGEKISQASSHRKNKQRLAGDRALMGVRTDLMFYTTISMVELGTTEVGLKSDLCSEKSINGLELKCPKVMKDMLLSLIEYTAPTHRRELTTCGFNISGVYINQLSMDNPAGYVCRVSRFPKYLKYPSSPANFLLMFRPILKTIWSARMQLELTLEKADTIEEMSTLRYGFSTEQAAANIPPCFTPITQRKRKGDDCDTSESKRRSIA